MNVTVVGFVRGQSRVSAPNVARKSAPASKNTFDAHGGLEHFTLRDASEVRLVVRAHRFSARSMAPMVAVTSLRETAPM